MPGGSSACISLAKPSRQACSCSALKAASGAARGSFLAALSLSTLWAVGVVALELAPTRDASLLVVALDLLRYGAWFAFMLALFVSDGVGPVSQGVRRLRLIGAIGVAVSGERRTTNNDYWVDGISQYGRTRSAAIAPRRVSSPSRSSAKQ